MSFQSVLNNIFFFFVFTSDLSPEGLLKKLPDVHQIIHNSCKGLWDPIVHCLGTEGTELAEKCRLPSEAVQLAA